MAYWTPQNANPLQNEAPRVAVGHGRAVHGGRMEQPSEHARTYTGQDMDMARYHIPQPRTAAPQPPAPTTLSLPPLPLLPLLLVAAAAASQSSLEEEEVVGQTRSTPRSNEYCSMLRGSRAQFFPRP